MADIEIDPVGERDNIDSYPDETGETIPLTTRGEMGGGPSWEPECKQEILFEGKVMKATFSKKNELKNCTSY